MRVMLDACVLYPTVMREVLLGCAKRGLFEPRWSVRILEEWARAAGKLGADQEVWARGKTKFTPLNDGSRAHQNGDDADS